MAFLRKQTSEGSVGLLYSIIQKCIRRGLENESLYYSQILYNECTKNCLRKRLIYVCNEDISNLKLSQEILECDDNDLFKYLIICCRMKKTHESAWLSRLALHYAMNNLKTELEELNIAIEYTNLVKKEDFKSIRQYLGKYSKMYSFTSKNNLVWASHILFHNRPELNQSYDINDIHLEEITPKKFNEIPFWVKDKHVPGGTKGYEFFFKNSLIMNKRLYEEDIYERETKTVYLNDEKNLGNGKTKILYNKWKESELNFPGFKDIVQVQLLTRKNNPKVYFATSTTDNKKYVLKGPMKLDMRKSVMKTENLKKLLDLKHLNVEFIDLFNQNWMKSDSLNDYDVNLKELKTSKLEGEVYIYSGPSNNFNFDDINENNFLKLFTQYLFRLLTGANDHCARNFIVKQDIIYSIDDHSVSNTFEFNNIKMKKSIKTTWNNYIIFYKKDIIEILNQWNIKTKDYKKTNLRINSLIDIINKFEIS